MTDINKQIEEASEDNHAGSFNQNSIWLQDQSFKAGANFILNKFRWRKVSEELPEVKDENFFINIKRYDNEFRIDTICVFAEMEDVKGYLEFNNVDSWKPIG